MTPAEHVGALPHWRSHNASRAATVRRYQVAIVALFGGHTVARKVENAVAALFDLAGRGTTIAVVAIAIVTALALGGLDVVVAALDFEAEAFVAATVGKPGCCAIRSFGATAADLDLFLGQAAVSLQIAHGVRRANHAVGADDDPVVYASERQARHDSEHADL